MRRYHSYENLFSDLIIAWRHKTIAFSISCSIKRIMSSHIIKWIDHHLLDEESQPNPNKMVNPSCRYGLVPDWPLKNQTWWGIFTTIRVEANNQLKLDLIRKRRRQQRRRCHACSGCCRELDPSTLIEERGLWNRTNFSCVSSKACEIIPSS